jgi:PAS domain-containing protein
MSRKPTYEELKQVVKDLNKESTERRLVEEELNVVYAALNSAASGVMITDKKGSIKYANPTFLRMFEYEFEKQVTGKYADELFAHQGRRRFTDIESIIDKSKGETEIFPALRKKTAPYSMWRFPPQVLLTMRDMMWEGWPRLLISPSASRWRRH